MNINVSVTTSTIINSTLLVESASLYETSIKDNII